MNQIYSKSQLNIRNLKSSDFYCRKFNGNFFYAKDENHYLNYMHKYKELIKKQLNDFLVINKSIFVRMLRIPINEDLDMKLISGLINKLYQDNDICMLTCYTILNERFYYSIYLKKKENFVNDIIKYIQEYLNKNKFITSHAIIDKYFIKTKGSTFIVKSIFDHLYFLGIVDYADNYTIRKVSKIFNE